MPILILSIAAYIINAMELEPDNPDGKSHYRHHKSAALAAIYSLLWKQFWK